MGKERVGSMGFPSFWEPGETGKYFAALRIISQLKLRRSTKRWLRWGRKGQDFSSQPCTNLFETSKLQWSLNPARVWPLYIRGSEYILLDPKLKPSYSISQRSSLNFPASRVSFRRELHQNNGKGDSASRESTCK